MSFRSKLKDYKWFIHFSQTIQIFLINRRVKERLLKRFKEKLHLIICDTISQEDIRSQVSVVVYDLNGFDFKEQANFSLNKSNIIDEDTASTVNHSQLD